MTDQTKPAGYYTTACICGANPAFHIGHTQQCADEAS